MSSTPYIKKITDDKGQAQAFEIRREVFVKEQKVDESLEIDGLDSECTQYLVILGEKAVGTARIFWMHDAAKIQRVAILQEYRGRGYAKLLMARLIADIKETEVQTIKLSAQLSALSLYEAFGFKAHGDIYLDANIPHKDMTLPIYHP